MDANNLQAALREFNDWKHLDQMQLQVARGTAETVSLTLRGGEACAGATITMRRSAVVRAIHDEMQQIAHRMAAMGVSSFLLYPTEPTEAAEVTAAPGSAT